MGAGQLQPAPKAFAHGRRSAVAVVHSLRGIDGPDYPYFPRAHFQCGGEMFLKSVTFVDAPAEGWRRCPRCIEALKASGEPAIYFAEKDGLIKIGVSVFPQRRVRSLPATLLATVPGDARTEAALHHVFADLRVVGEWFLPGPALMQLVNRLVADQPENLKASA